MQVDGFSIREKVEFFFQLMNDSVARDMVWRNIDEAVS